MGGTGKRDGAGEVEEEELLENEDLGMIPDFQLEDLCEWQGC